MAGAFHGGIIESDSKKGTQSGLLSEGWVGGEAAQLGIGKVTKPGEAINGWFGFGGLGISAGPLAGCQVGIVVGNGWIGVYAEGHLTAGATGGGAYWSWKR